jgi:hypothetical protein
MHSRNSAASGFWIVCRADTQFGKCEKMKYYTMVLSEAEMNLVYDSLMPEYLSFGDKSKLADDLQERIMGVLVEAEQAEKERMQ